MRQAAQACLASLIETGVPNIILVLSSPGDQIDPTLETCSFIRSLPAKIDTHTVGFVQSSATALYLAGDSRAAGRKARFMFHPWTVLQPTEATEQSIREHLSQMENMTDMQLSIMRERTRLSSEMLEEFRRGKVLLTSEQAMEVGSCTPSPICTSPATARRGSSYWVDRYPARTPT